MTKVNVNPLCLQEFDMYDMVKYQCNYKDCKTCGHNIRVARWRKMQLQERGMTRRKDGLWTFVINERK